MLCFALVKDRFHVEYVVDDDAFYVHIDDEKVLRFGRRNNIYPCNLRQHSNYCMTTTVVDKESMYTQRELKGARAAKELSAQLGYPSVKDLLEVINTGSIINLHVTARDVERAHKIYGPDLAAIKGKTTSKKKARANVDVIVKHVRAEQVLHADIMFVNGEPFLVSISMPLGLLMVTDLKGRRTAAAVRDALWSQLAVYDAERFKVMMILTDGEGAIAKISELIRRRGIQVNIAGAGQHVPAIERQIRMIKERCRGIINTLPFTIAKPLIKYLLYYVVSRLNLIPSSTSASRISPREIFTGRKADYNHDLRITFGEYCQVNEPDDIGKNGLKSRTIGAIALVPTGNLQGSVRFLSLSTGQV